ncbi:hypothetical protein XENOCAPTIV_012981, partial [Xenoophorus captivus]
FSPLLFPISRCLELICFILFADVTQEINEAKTVAEKANSTATKVNNMLRPIKEQLDQWQQAYMQKLEEHIPTLMKKLDDLQNYSVQMPNISENINRIRQLIQEARNTASKVSVPMKFNGRSAVQVRTPSNLADLAAYSSLKFYITLSETKQRKRSSDDTKPQLVFFLGNKNVCLTTASQMDILWTRGTNAYYFYNHYHLDLILVPRSNVVVVRSARTIVFKHPLGQELPEFKSKYYLGGVPEEEMPERLVGPHDETIFLF